MKIQPNKAIVGQNAFAHESGIHQDGVLKERSTYEIMNPELIGRSLNTIVLGKHSGRHAFRESLSAPRYELNEEEINRVFQRFKMRRRTGKKRLPTKISALSSKKRFCASPKFYRLAYLHVSKRTTVVPTATYRPAERREELDEAACATGRLSARSTRQSIRITRDTVHSCFSYAIRRSLRREGCPGGGHR